MPLHTLLSVVLTLSIVYANPSNSSIDDSNPLVIYSPQSSWISSSSPCTSQSCLSVHPQSNQSAFQQTWHTGVHIIPNTDEDDEPGKVNGAPDTDGDAPSSSSISTSSTSTSASTSASSSTAAATQNNDNTDVESDTDSKKKGTHHSKKRFFDLTPFTLPSASDLPILKKLRSLRVRDNNDPFEVPSLDADDSGFVDTPVYASINFTGTSIYLYAILPLFAPSGANSTPTLTNLTYILDNDPDGNFLFQGTQSPSTPTSPPSPSSSSSPSSTSENTNSELDSEANQNYKFSALVYSRTNITSSSSSSSSNNPSLQQQQHSLTIQVGPNSIFLFDYAVVTTDSDSDSNSSTTGGDDKQTTSTMSTNHNVATFAGAVGGSLGILTLLALGLFISIRRRRYLAERRAGRERGAEIENGSGSRRRRRGARRGAGAGVEYARRFTERDHGNAESVESDEEDAVPSYDYMDDSLSSTSSENEEESETWSDGEIEGGEDGTGRPGIVRQNRNRNRNGLGLALGLGGRIRGRNNRRNNRNNRQPAMTQVRPTHFVPRYFPGTLPASPPPYPAVAGDSAPPLNDVDAGEMVSLPEPLTSLAINLTNANVNNNLQYPSSPVSIPYLRSQNSPPPFTPSPLPAPLRNIPGSGLDSGPTTTFISPLTPPATYVYSTSGETNRTHLPPPLIRQESSGSVISTSYADRPPPTPPPLGDDSAAGVNVRAQTLSISRPVHLNTNTNVQFPIPTSSSLSGETSTTNSLNAGAHPDSNANANTDVDIDTDIDEILRIPLTSIQDPPPPPFGQTEQDTVICTSESQGIITSTSSTPVQIEQNTVSSEIPNTASRNMNRDSSPSIVMASTSTRLITVGPDPVSIEPLTIFEHLSRSYSNSQRATPASSIRERGSPVNSRAGTPPLDLRLPLALANTIVLSSSSASSTYTGSSSQNPRSPRYSLTSPASTSNASDPAFTQSHTPSPSSQPHSDTKFSPSESGSSKFSSAAQQPPQSQISRPPSPPTDTTSDDTTNVVITESEAASR